MSIGKSCFLVSVGIIGMSVYTVFSRMTNDIYIFLTLFIIFEIFISDLDIFKGALLVRNSIFYRIEIQFYEF